MLYVACCCHMLHAAVTCCMPLSHVACRCHMLHAAVTCCMPLSHVACCCHMLHAAVTCCMLQGAVTTQLEWMAHPLLNEFIKHRNNKMDFTREDKKPRDRGRRSHAHTSAPTRARTHARAYTHVHTRPYARTHKQARARIRTHERTYRCCALQRLEAKARRLHS